MHGDTFFPRVDVFPFGIIVLSFTVQVSPKSENEKSNPKIIIWSTP
jgi:hypothetical protein